MGSFKWGCKTPHMGYNYSYPTYCPLITAHELPSLGRSAFGITEHFTQQAGASDPVAAALP